MKTILKIFYLILQIIHLMKSKKKINIELMWNELIFLKNIDKIILDKNKFLKKIENVKNKIKKEYKLSEIVFKKDKDTNLDIHINKILSSIMDIGFENTANIYSISESSKMGGDIGWINENNLSELISKNIKLSSKTKLQIQFKLEIIFLY